MLTLDSNINIVRVKGRKAAGGHDVPKEKIISRYDKALKLVTEFVQLCDVCHIYDNSDKPYRIFKKSKAEYFYWENCFWKKKQIENLVGIKMK